MLAFLGEREGAMKCENCGSEDVKTESFPGMAGWVSPIFQTTCNTCDFVSATEELILDEDGDIA